MSIEHFGLLSWFHERAGPQNAKTMRKMAGRCAQRAISIRRSCHGLYVSDGVHPFVRMGILPRPAAGLLLDASPEHDLLTLLRMIASEQFGVRFSEDHAKTRAMMRA
jgi:hypothetical protein